MSSPRLQILCVSHIPASPPRSGAQARMHGLTTELAKRHDVTAVVLIDDQFDLDICRDTMERYCKRVVLVRNPVGQSRLSKRTLQLRSMASRLSFERLRVSVPSFQETLDDLLQAQRFDIVNLEFPFLGHHDFRKAPPGERPPAIVVDCHDVTYDLVRQFARKSTQRIRRYYAEVNWRKLRREELDTYRAADGIYLCSAEDQQRILEDIPTARSAVIPNAADVNHFKPDAGFPQADGRTVVYFGLLSTTPNMDGVRFLTNDIWPRIADAVPDARLRIIGGHPPPAIRALEGPRIEVTGFVDDIRPHLAEAAAIVVPLRLGGGTRLKIVEAMAMGKAVVSTRLGAEGIAIDPGRNILIADKPGDFADAVCRLLNHPDLASEIGRAARGLAEARYSWDEAAHRLESFMLRIVNKAEAETT